MPFPLPIDEAERLEALRRYDVLDASPEAAFDRITRLAARLFEVPVSVISFVDEDRQVFKSRHGIESCSTSREVAFCAHTVMDDEVLVVEDARRDPRFADNPLVTGESHLRFYAGAPLVTPDGYRLGALCLVDRVPRTLDAAERDLLIDLAAMVVRELELRREVRERRQVEQRLRLAGEEADRTLDALRSERAFSESILDALADPFFVLDLEGRFTVLNRRVGEVTGYADEELRGVRALDLFGEEDALRVGVALDQVVREGRALVEAELVTRDGQRLPYEFSGAVLRDADGAVSGICGVGRDLSERRAAEERAHLGEARLEHLLATVDEVVWEATLDGSEMLYINDAAEEIFGRPAEAFRADAHLWFEAVHPDDRARVEEGMGRLRAHGYDESEFRIVRPDGEVRRLHHRGYVLEDAQGRPTYLAGLAADVTARHEAEVSARRHRAMLQSFFDTAPLMMGVVELEGDALVHVADNRTTAAFFGIEPEAMQGRTARELGVPPVMRALWIDAYRRCRDEGAPVAFEYDHRGDEGTARLRAQVAHIGPAGPGRDRFSYTVEDVTVQRQTEQMLRSTARRFGALIQNLQAGVLVEDERGRILLANEHFCDLFGIDAPPAALAGMDCAAAAASARALFRDPDAFVQGIHDAVAREEGVQGEALGLVDGRTLVRDYVPVTLDGSHGGGLWLYHDVTERRRNERALRRREQLLEGVAAALRGLLADDHDGAVDDAFALLGGAVEVDRVYLFELHEQEGRLLASQRHEWVAPSIAAQIDNPDLQDLPLLEYYPRWHRELSAGRPIVGAVSDMPDVERPALEAQDIRSLLVVPVHLEGRLWGLMGFDDCHGERRWSAAEQATLTAAASSVGEAILRRRTEADLRASRNRYSQVVNTVKDVVFATDAAGAWTFLNPAWEEITGFAVDETLGRPFFDYVHPDDRKRNEALFAPLIAREKDYCRHEVRYLTRSGGFRWVEVFARLVEDERGRIVGTSGTLHDVTERYEAMRALEQALEREREAGQLKSRFVSMASHELRTPLTTIKSSSELLQQFGAGLGPERRDALFGRILKSVDTMTDLIADVLVLGRVDAREFPFDPRPTDVAALCEELVHELRQSEGVRHHLRVKRPAAAVEAVADPKLLALAVGNLLTNAVKYAPPGTDVDLRVEPADRHLRVAVTDRGIGIPEEDLPRLFEPFHRAANTDNRAGTGLGLAITQRAVDQHGGTIHVESTVGQGSTFTITLPLEHVRLANGQGSGDQVASRPVLK